MRKKTLCALMLISIPFLSACGETEEERTARLEKEKREYDEWMTEVKSSNPCEQLANGILTPENEKGCEEYMGLTDEQKYAQVDYYTREQALEEADVEWSTYDRYSNPQPHHHSGGNSLLYYLMWKDMFDSRQRMYYSSNRFFGEAPAFNSSNLKSPIAKETGVVAKPNGNFEIPKIGQDADKVFGKNTNVVQSGFASTYSRGALGGGSHK